MAENLAAIIEAKSGGRLLSCDADGLRSRLGYDVVSMRTSAYDPSVVEEHEAFNDRLEQFIAHPQFGRYLRALTPNEVFGASGVGVLPLDAIREEIQELAPGTRLFPYGYMPFATSIGGNAICFHAPTGQVVWADHDSFGADEVTYKDRDTGDYRTVPFTPECIAQAVVPLAGDFDAFLADLMHDRLETRLDELD
jgi:hypothetical protein